MGFFTSLIGLVFSILSLVYLFKIRSDTNDNIFKQPIVPSIKEKFFYSTNTTPAVNPADISIKCELYQESIINPKVTMLGDVFNLNIDNIHSKANLLLLFDILIVIMVILTFIIIYILIKTESNLALCLTCFVSLGNLGLCITNIVMTILFLFSYFNGDTNRFIEFLSCKNVNKNEFSDYLFAEKLKKDFTIFIVLSFINSFTNSFLNSKTDSNFDFGQQNDDHGLRRNEGIVSTK